MQRRWFLRVMARLFVRQSAGQSVSLASSARPSPFTAVSACVSTGRRSLLFSPVTSPLIYPLFCFHFIHIHIHHSYYHGSPAYISFVRGIISLSYVSLRCSFIFTFNLSSTFIMIIIIVIVIVTRLHLNPSSAGYFTWQHLGFIFFIFIKFTSIILISTIIICSILLSYTSHLGFFRFHYCFISSLQSSLTIIRPSSSTKFTVRLGFASFIHSVFVFH